MRFPVAQPDRPQPPETLISGRCWVIDGDTIVIDNKHIRIAGIDAPELDHPWGRQAKWAMVKLCKGQTVTARIKPELSYDRLVAECLLPDGRDLAAELVKAGLALDWPKFSGGKYRQLEPPDVGKKLWRAKLRQGGVTWPADGVVPLPARPVALPSRTPMPSPEASLVRIATARRWIGWLVGCFALVMLVGCQLLGGATSRGTPAAIKQQVPAVALFAVTATALNVRARPGANARILGQVGEATTFTPKQISGPWYGIEMGDGSMGWVHSDFVSRIGD
jgi:hypothetical protein